MSKKFIKIFFSGLLAFTMLFSSFMNVMAATPVKINLAAAASLKNAFVSMQANLLADGYDISEVTGSAYTTSYDSSGKLLNAMNDGSLIADVFISAAEAQMDSLQNVSPVGIVAGTRIDVFENELVLIKNKLTSTNITGTETDDELAAKILQVDKVVIGDPSIVPAGAYAEQSLIWYEIYDTLLANTKIFEDTQLVVGTLLDSYPSNVTNVLNAIAGNNGANQLGMVYRTDAMSNANVDVVASTNPDSHDSVIYPAAVVGTASNPTDAQAFINLLRTPKYAAIFKTYGFTPLNIIP